MGLSQRFSSEKLISKIGNNEDQNKYANEQEKKKPVM